MEELIRSFASLEFASPLYFWIGGAVILFGIFIPFFRKRRLLRFDLGYWNKKVKLGSKKAWTIPVLIIIISLLVAAVLAGPQIIEKRSIPFYGKPVMVVTDISGSMSAKYNEEISKFEKTKEVFYDLVEQDLGASIGLLIYSSESYIARDFATKTELLKDTLENEGEIQEISSGTNTTRALWEARRFFSEKVQAEDKTIVLISDLMDNLDRVGREMQKISEEDIKIYVIVVDEKSERAYGSIQTLKSIVGSEDVKMVWAEDKEGINRIYEEIRQMEISLTGEEEILSQRSLTPVLLPIIFGLIVLSIVLSETIFRKIP